MHDAETAAAALQLSKQIRPLLRGRGPEIQGAALADLVALYFAGHAPDIREEQIGLWIGAMRELIEPSIGEIGYLPWQK